MYRSLLCLHVRCKNKNSKYVFIRCSFPMVDGGLMEMAKGNEVDHSKRDGENMTGGKGNACRDT